MAMVTSGGQFISLIFTSLVSLTLYLMIRQSEINCGRLGEGISICDRFKFTIIISKMASWSHQEKGSCHLFSLSFDFINPDYTTVHQRIGRGICERTVLGDWGRDNLDESHSKRQVKCFSVDKFTGLLRGKWWSPYCVSCWNRVKFVEYHCSVPGKHSYEKARPRNVRGFTYRYINQGFWSYLVCWWRKATIFISVKVSFSVLSNKL